MAEFTAFPGLRYAGATDLSHVAAPPYDVIDETERERLESLDPHNAVRLILPRDRTGDDRYAVAADLLTSWQRDGALVRDAGPTMTIVRMTFTDAAGTSRSTLGVLGALALPSGDTGGGAGGDGEPILPHERTLPKAKSDRLALLQATRANLDPIWGLSLTAGLSALLDPQGPPDLTVVDGDELHEAWVLDDETRIADVSHAIAGSPLVLADGHHRFETAKRYRDDQAEAGVDDPGAAAVMAYVVELAEDQLDIGPIHRLLRLPTGLDPRERLEGDFRVEDAGPNRPEGVSALVARCAAEDGIGLVDHSGLSFVKPRENVRSVTRQEWSKAVASTDAALVESTVRPRLEGAEWEYRAGAEDVAGLVRDGTADAALLLKPVSVKQTRAVAESGERMPQKTTFFRPKPRTGFVFRTLD